MPKERNTTGKRGGGGGGGKERGREGGREGREGRREEGRAGGYGGREGGRPEKCVADAQSVLTSLNIRLAAPGAAGQPINPAPLSLTQFRFTAAKLH